MKFSLELQIVINIKVQYTLDIIHGVSILPSRFTGSYKLILTCVVYFGFELEIEFLIKMILEDN